MNLIREAFPDVTPERAHILVGEVVTQRDFVAIVAHVFKEARWGSGCLEYEWARIGLQRLCVSGTYSWLRYLPEQGQAYTMMVGSAPVRIQSESEQFRPVMPNERQVMAGRGQLRLAGLSAPSSDAILRLEVYQRAGEPVERVTLFMFDESSNVQLDEWRIYQRATVGESDNAPNTNVVEFRRPAETPSVTEAAFLDAESASDDEEK
jgi:hypothetical protein